MREFITAVLLLLNAAICLRLLAYRSSPEARQRTDIGLLAWVLIASTGGHALQILLFGCARQPNSWQLGVLSVLLVLTYRARGNVARIMRMD